MSVKVPKLSLIYGLEDVNNVPIVNMNASWTTKTYSLFNYLHLCAHLFWDDISPEGILYMDYSGDPKEDGEDVPADGWTLKNAITLDGTFQDTMFLDANLAVGSFRFRFEYTAGAADLQSRIVRKP